VTRKRTKFARELRENSTDAERLFWSRVRDRRLDGHKFKRQHTIGPYIVDFVCAEQMLVVELDGGQHADSMSDKARDARLMAEGYRVLRFWNNDVLLNIDGVIETVLKNLRQPSPQPSPSKGEGVQKRE
jgi:very-short-patch-repair endonuclease